ncbi:hypothetical protein GO755_04500 [Spirosoma sp. HMF4905]|uniref:Uncharacterized protein n=1 Tax=Spirosoma arboris TaxID=2682092 RepID=A0A7K1S635_9BACT|nr:hypothetical protein [Spirosoma arboris]MVM29282.1 hypothetical protein [Spirosoma arboris]
MNIGKFALTADYFAGELEIILNFIVDCFQILKEKEKNIANDEEIIRNLLYARYLTNSSIKKQLDFTSGRFCAEPATIDKDTLKETGYLDLKVCLANHFNDDDIFFIIECKRLDGGNTLNREYVREGINRFITSQYPSHLSVNAMIGFCVTACDLDGLVTAPNGINYHINKWISPLTVQSLESYHWIDYFTSTYSSRHKISSSISETFSLYHVILDFSEVVT